ncbi:MAG: hypothetical protein WCO06_03155 [Candidatus Roizmanbacteria bacterium]
MKAVTLEQYIEVIKKEPDYFKKAKIIHILQNEWEVPLNDIAKRLSMQPAYLCHILRLNKLPELVIDGYYSQLISISHLYVIARLHDTDTMINIYEKVLSDALSVLGTEELVRENLYGIKTEGHHVSKDVLHQLVQQFSSIDEHIVSKVIQTRIKAKLIIEIKGTLKDTSQILHKISKAILSPEKST